MKIDTLMYIAQGLCLATQTSLQAAAHDKIVLPPVAPDSGKVPVFLDGIMNGYTSEAVIGTATKGLTATNALVNTAEIDASLSTAKAIQAIIKGVMNKSLDFPPQRAEQAKTSEAASSPDFTPETIVQAQSGIGVQALFQKIKDNPHFGNLKIKSPEDVAAKLIPQNNPTETAGGILIPYRCETTKGSFIAKDGKIMAVNSAEFDKVCKVDPATGRVSNRPLEKSVSNSDHNKKSAHR